MADRQTAGHGQHGRNWESAPGGLYVSVFLDHGVVSPVFTLLAGVAAIGACREVSGAEGLGLKWVNDLVWDGRKLGGLLAEVTHRKWLILGVGINLGPVALPEAVGLAEAAGRPIARDDLLARLLGRLEVGVARWRADGAAAIVADWVADSVTIGQVVRVDTGGETVMGRAIGLDADGRLLLELATGQVRQIASGTVRLADGRYA